MQATKVFAVALKLCGFRNIIAHCPLAMTKREDGTYDIHGIISFTPKDHTKAGEIISLEELTGRIDESAKIAQKLLKMQGVFSAT